MPGGIGAQIAVDLAPPSASARTFAGTVVLQMAGSIHLKVTVLVKAAPVLTSAFDETMCVAGFDVAMLASNGSDSIRSHFEISLQTSDS